MDCWKASALDCGGQRRYGVGCCRGFRSEEILGDADEIIQDWNGPLVPKIGNQLMVLQLCCRRAALSVL